ncbi:multidrug efflux pump subunit AcrA (membrane-fusion protein) [Herbihabitans rhizosphaerae]|uniref:Multidrug efflux pump subunit AcrA (Membrane-fusion protein) n=1 Tax=Herbihabitans rhizosphaerae TaxID=1872711 RepID=A0A4Q7KN16_9PSEU|nr:multidrug efflux pump subunit AcrA (membrane-fusion protein) [Herbihabitans rhizosphaerae]
MAAVAVVLLTVAGGAVAVTAFGADLGLRDPAGEPATSGPPATAPVIRGTLVDTRRESGKLSYGDVTPVAGRLGGTVTELAAVGSTVHRGQSLYRADNTPVVLLYGPLPAYRVLAPGTVGADVQQFEQNLKALGYKGFAVDDKYAEATAAAVKKWQKSLGLPETGVVELGRVVYAPGPVRVDAHKSAVGDELQPGRELLGRTGSTRVVVVELAVSAQRLARTGTPVSVTLPNGTVAGGRIARSRTIVAPGTAATQTTKIEVTVTVDDEQVLAGLDQASVDVAFTASRRENVLSVPVAALLALPEGGYGVQIVDGAGTRVVPVQTGMFANGRVEITGAGITESTRVGVPS